LQADSSDNGNDCVHSCFTNRFGSRSHLAGNDQKCLCLTEKVNLLATPGLRDESLMRGVFAGRLAGQEQEIPYMQQVMSHASTAGKENVSVEPRRIYKSREVKYLVFNKVAGPNHANIAS
jgi:hypothetical protein